MRIPLSMYRRIWKYARIKVGDKLGLPVPPSYTMKTEWIKQFDRNPMFVTLADKVEAKRHVAKLIGEEYLIPTIGVYKSADEIDFAKLPQKFVLKTNNASGTNIICTDKASLDVANTRRLLDKWVKNRNFGWKEREWHYPLIEPRILCEEFVNDSHGELRDFKFFCFNGKPHYVQVDIDRYKKTKSRAIFDVSWNRQKMRLSALDYHGDIPKPENYGKMVELASILSAGFKSVRVDFYNVDGKIYFGEFTFFAGDMIFTPSKYDEVWGRLIDLSK